MRGILVLAALALACGAHGVEVCTKFPYGWVDAGAADDAERLSGSVVFAVKQNPDGLAWLDRTFWDVSNPKSPNYTNYVKFSAIAKRVAPLAAARAAVERAIASIADGQTTVWRSLAGDWVFVSGVSAKAARAAFNADVRRFQHPGTGKTVVKAASHQLPADVEAAVDFVFGLSDLPNPERRRPTVVYSSPNLLGVTPSTLDTAYNLGGYVGNNTQNKQAVFAALEQYFNPDDLRTFQTHFNLPVKPIVVVEGDNIPGDPGIEANLDVQYISATGRGVDTWFIYQNGTVNQGQEDFLRWITNQTSDDNSPWVHSASYGDEERSIPFSYVSRCEAEFQKFGVSGRSVLFASGDSGVSCYQGKQDPDWPASSAYITSIGGTEPGSGGDTVWPDGGSGFSNYLSQPSYQTAAVSAYLKGPGVPPSQYFNASGRAYPDLAVYAVNFEIVYGGQIIGVAGTSCAAPTTAGIISQLNDVRLNAGKGTLGFLNPLLYQWGAEQPQAFHDITTGQNIGGQCPGFKAEAGWDAASGWGSPNFSEMRKLV